MASEMSSSGGVGFLGLLAVLFIGLKLAGLIHWNWLWVLTPIWFPLAVLLAVCVGAYLFGICVVVMEGKDK